MDKNYIIQDNWNKFVLYVDSNILNCDPDDSPTLFVCAQYNKADMITYLIKKGMNVNYLTTYTIDNKLKYVSALEIAIHFNSLDAISVLLNSGAIIKNTLIDACLKQDDGIYDILIKKATTSDIEYAKRYILKHYDMEKNNVIYDFCNKRLFV